MINTAVKDWLAKNAGVSSCFSPYGVSYKDPDGVSRTGSTGDVLNAFLVANMIGKSTTVIIANTAYTTLKSINNMQDITMDDVAWVYSNDGTGTEQKYCVSAAVTPTPTPVPGVTPTPPPVDRAGVFVFVGPIEGDPTVNLDLSGLVMRQAYDSHFEMNGIIITNTSSHPVYIAMRIKLFAGDLPVCRDTGYVFDGMDRTDTELRSLRVKTLEVGESATYNADFFQPAHIRGLHTICMLIHGAWSRADLVDEVEHISG